VLVLTSWLKGSSSRSLGVLLWGALSMSVAHAQATINDCEKIQAADAYNQCLAKFGPEEKTHNLEPERPGDIKGSSEEAAAGAGKGGHASRGGRRHRGGHAGRHGGGGGRKRMTITVGHRHR
jgi:hypothetical protein